MPLALVSALHWLLWNTSSLWEDKEQDLPLALSSVPAQLLPSLFPEAGKGVHPPCGFPPVARVGQGLAQHPRHPHGVQTKWSQKSSVLSCFLNINGHLPRIPMAWKHRVNAPKRPCGPWALHSTPFELQPDSLIGSVSKL